MKRKHRRPFPAFSLEDSLTIGQAIQDKNAGRPMKRLLVAEAIGRKPMSSDFRDLLSSSFKYGLTIGSEKAEDIQLTSLGETITKPLNKVERMSGIRKATMEPDLFGRIFKHYDQHKLPAGEFFQNALEREFEVPREYAAECEKLIAVNGKFAGLIVDIGGSPHVMIDKGETEIGIEEPIEEYIEEEELELTSQEKSQKPSPQSTPRKILIGHGKNKKPLDQLKKILDELKVPYKVAIDEPHGGRPISEKVAEIMQECTSGIFIFTSDEEAFDKDGNTIWRPSENVIYELGAASVLYGNKLVIFKEEGIDFPSDFRDIGYISFKKDELDAKAADLLKELINFGLLKISPA